MTGKTDQRRCIATVRVRGTVSASLEARETLKMLHLTKNNYAVLIDDRESFIGMVNTVRDYITYGDPSQEIVTLLIKKRGRLEGNKKLMPEYARKVGYQSLEDLAAAVHGCRMEYWKLPGIRTVFRLHPPTKGYKGNIKKGYGSGGELGYRGDKIDKLLERMV